MRDGRLEFGLGAAGRSGWSASNLNLCALLKVPFNAKGSLEDKPKLPQ